LILAAAVLLLLGAAPSHRFIQVTLPASAAHAVSGRLLVMARAVPQGDAPAMLDVNELQPGATRVAAQEVSDLAPGGAVDVDLDAMAYPADLPAGRVAFQAVLDVHHDYAYAGREGGDVASKVSLATSADLPALSLTEPVAAADPLVLPADASAEEKAAFALARPHVTPLAYPSLSLAKFWGRPKTVRGWVLTPPDYDPAGPALYPTVYYFPGYGSSLASFARHIGYIDNAMRHHQMAPMIWVFLDQSSQTGTHEFADSVNNGPWGNMLTRELVPYLQVKYRMRIEPGARYLTGHSSGGWAALWVISRYPALFGGAWATAPDPVDFHDFSGVDLYAPGANMYTAPDGSKRPLMRAGGKPGATIESVAKLERVLGPTGGQLSSFDWVFSPRGPDGRPEPLFDRDTGAVDHDVAAHWEEAYDIAGRIASHAGVLRHALPGKIHVIVGTADTFFLDGPVHRLQAVMDHAGLAAQFTYLPGRTHSDLYVKGDDKGGLLKDIVADMAKAASAVPVAKPAPDDDAPQPDKPGLGDAPFPTPPSLDGTRPQE
jgi:hypothetical protein